MTFRLAMFLILAPLVQRANAETPGAPTTDVGSAIRRAVDYLSREVPAWSIKNNCFSCHNNGDGARALYQASAREMHVAESVLRATTEWLANPDGWRHNGGDGPYSDRKLANLQFTVAQSEASRASLIAAESRRQAGRLLALDQHPDGSWQVNAGALVGSPVTYGSVLATVLARDALRQFGERVFLPIIVRATQWLARQRARSVLDAAALLSAFPQDEEGELVALREHCWALIQRGQSAEGGWGPFVDSPSEPFDTAVVLLGLEHQKQNDNTAAVISRGRTYLVQSQLEDGSWVETTRPAQARSYAQRISTTAWATMALLGTERE
jgi:hypothetical protein